MSNFLWTIIFALCNIMFILPQNTRNRTNTEHDSPKGFTHKNWLNPPFRFFGHAV